MEYLIILGGVLFIGLFYFIPLLSQNKRLNSIYTALAGQLKIDFEKKSILQRPKLNGYFENHHINLDSYYKNPLSKYNRHLVIELTMTCRMPVRFRITREKATTKIGKLFGAKDVEIGDEYVDSKYFLEGDRIPLYLILTTAMRRLLDTLYIHTEDFEVTQNNLHAEFDESSPDVSSLILSVVKKMAEIEKAISGEHELTDLLLKNIQSENNIITVLEIIDALKDTKSSGVINNDAVFHHLLEHPTFRVRARAAGALREEGLNFLLIHCTDGRSDEEKIILLRELSSFDDPRAEKTILLQLNDRNIDVVLHAIQALGNFPHAAVCRKLNKIGQSKTVHNEIRRAAQKMLRQLRKQLDVSDQGWLSVSDTDESGALDIAEEPE